MLVKHCGNTVMKADENRKMRNVTQNYNQRQIKADYQKNKKNHASFYQQRKTKHEQPTPNQYATFTYTIGATAMQ